MNTQMNMSVKSKLEVIILQVLEIYNYSRNVKNECNLGLELMMVANILILSMV